MWGDKTWEHSDGGLKEAERGLESEAREGTEQ